MNMISKGVKTFCDPISKLIKEISDAIGKTYEPYHIHRMADADAYRIRKISEEMRNNSDLPIREMGLKLILQILRSCANVQGVDWRIKKFENKKILRQS